MPPVLQRGITRIQDADDYVRCNFDWGDASPKTIATIPAGTRVLSARAIITTAFDGVGAALSVGDAGDYSRLLDVSDIDPAAIGEYAADPGYLYAAQTDLKLSINPGTGASAGSGFVLLEIAN